MLIDLKSKEDIEKYKTAGQEAGRILNKLLQFAIPNNIGLNLDELAREECRKIGAIPVFLNYRGYPAAICVSKNKTLVHGIPNNEPFQDGDLLSIDFGLSIDGFIGDVAKTVVVGQASYENMKLINVCAFSLQQVTKKIKAGNKLCDIGGMIEQIAKQNGFKVPREYGGHGISRNNLHAAPFIPNYYNESDSVTLRSGMILALEPMLIDAQSEQLTVAKDGWSVIANGNTSHFEHTILVTDSELVILTGV